jgi:macrolide transport system ATP-binding/permease protein
VSSENGRPAVRIENLRKDYLVGGEILHVLKGVNLEVPEGDYVAIMGPSGSGKSTFLNVLGCLDPATSGLYELGGENVANMDDDRLAQVRSENIGFVFQSYNLITSLTVLENIQAPLYYGGTISAEDLVRCGKMAERVGLADRLDHRPSQLSGGQQQRAGIARSLINRPRFILADEATGNLDSVTTTEILDLIDELNREGTTIIMVTHEEDVAKRARRIVRLRDGVVQSDTRFREVEWKGTGNLRSAEKAPNGGAPKKRDSRGDFSTGLQRWIRPWALGVKTLHLHPMRSLLTILGIFIGVASVIWLLAIGEGISRKAQEEIARMGANNVIVSTIQPASDSKSVRRLFGVTKDDYEDLAQTIPSIKKAIPYRELSQADCEYGGRSMSVPVRGVTPDYSAWRRLGVRKGNFITDTHVVEEAKVCVLGAKTAYDIFLHEDPIGKSVQISFYTSSDFYTVVGVAGNTGEFSDSGSDSAGGSESTAAYVPLTTYWRNVFDFYGRSERGIPTVTKVVFEVDNPALVMETASIIRKRLKETHDQTDYEVLVPLELLKRAENTRIMFIAMLGLVAAISLVVGGIGIMNIMLATVTERTREIGIRRALGARRSDITRQFLVETIVLSVVGGLVGIIAGFLASPAITGLRSFLLSTAPEMMKDAPESIMTMVPIVVPWSIPLAFGISVAVGVIFGMYPANKAAAMDPIQALRHVN